MANKDAKDSLEDEREAIRDYGKKAARAKGGLKRVFKENREEEREHASRLKPYTRKSTR